MGKFSHLGQVMANFLKWCIVLLVAMSKFSHLGQIMVMPSLDRRIVVGSSNGPSSDALLLETGDSLLLESGDFLLLE